MASDFTTIRKFIYLLTYSFILLLTPSIGQQSVGSPTSLQHFPDNLVITLDREKFNSTAPQEIYFFSQQNITDIKVYVTDISTTDGSLTIPKSDFMVEPREFNVTAGRISILTIKPALRGEYVPETYIGRLLLQSHNITTVELPLEVKIIEPVLKRDIVTAEPSPIRFVFNDENIKLNEINVDLYSNSTLRKVRASFDNLRTENGTVISNETLKVDRETFDMNPANPARIRIIMDLSGHQPSSGTYYGNLKLSADNTLTAVPIIAIIESPSSWYSPVLTFALVVIGVFLSVFLILSQEGARVRDSMVSSAQDAYNELEKAIKDKRKSRDEIMAGLHIFMWALINLRGDSRYSDANADFVRAKRYFGDATREGDQIDWILMPPIDDVRAILRRSTRATMATAFQGDRLYGITFSIIVVVVILTTLQGTSNDLLVIDTFIEGVAAILFGFGSPAIANLLVPLIRRDQAGAKGA